MRHKKALSTLKNPSTEELLTLRNHQHEVTEAAIADADSVKKPYSQSHAAILGLQSTIGNQAVMRLLNQRRQAETTLQRDMDYGKFSVRGQHTLFDKQVPTTLKDLGVAKITTNHVIPHNRLKALAAKVKTEMENGNPALDTAFRGLLGDAVEGAFELRGTKRALKGESDADAGFLRFDQEEYTNYVKNPTAENLPDIKQNRWKEFGITGKGNKSEKLKSAMETSLNEMFTWMPWNLFKGPVNSQRFDDPGEGFEENSAPIIGEETYNHLKAAYNNIDGDPATAITEIQAAKTTRKKQDVIQFKPGQWITALEHFKNEGTLGDKFKFKPKTLIGPSLPRTKTLPQVKKEMVNAAIPVLDSFLRLKEMQDYQISDGVLKRAVNEARQAALIVAAENGYDDIGFEK